VAAKLAEMTGRSPDTIKQHLHRVRKAGFLTTIPGKAGGQLTDKAGEAIRQAMDVAVGR
jgi:DNA-binding IscR family transcriptional regulator